MIEEECNMLVGAHMHFKRGCTDKEAEVLQIWMNMDLKSASPGSGLPSANCVNDPEEKERSDDDDHIHKHPRWETRSQSLDRDPEEQTLTQPYGKCNRPFDNAKNNP